jgi:hypothetical protein
MRRFGLLVVLAGLMSGLAAQAAVAASWSVQSAADPSPASSQYAGVSCTSASACTAAGGLNNGHEELALAERYS